MERYSFFNRHRGKSYRVLISCLSLLFILWGCGGGSSEQESTVRPDTGSASLAIQWHTNSTGRAAAIAPQAIENCETAGVGSITCTVYDESHIPIASGGPWDCSDYHGTIEGIPAGTNRIFAVLGRDGADTIVYQGQTEANITILPGQITDTGTIDARPFVPTTPEPTAVYGNRIDLSWNDLGFDRYRIYRDGRVLAESTSANYSDSDLSQQTQYCYTISTLDGFGNESGPSAQTCPTTGLLPIWFRDGDNDNFGDPNNSIQAVDRPTGYVGDKTDCKDNDNTIYPGANDVCGDGIDSDCDGLDCACHPNLPPPILNYIGSYLAEGPDGRMYRYYDLTVTNSDDYPNELFIPAPDLPSCGTNSDSSRTRVDIYDDSGTNIYEDCALTSSAGLKSLQFAMPAEANPPNSVYIELTDRACVHTYVSDPVDIDNNPSSISPPTNLRIQGGGTLTWDPNADNPDGYHVYWRLQGSEYDYSAPTWAGTSTIVTLNDIPDGSTSYFVARAFIGNIESEDSNEVEFVKELPVLVKSTLISPDNGAYYNRAIDKSIAFSWSSVPGATRYYIAIRAPVNLNDDSILRHDAEVMTNTYSMPLTDIQEYELGQWSWAVYPLNDIESEPTVALKSEVWYFEIQYFEPPF